MLRAHRECSRLCLRMRRRLEHAAERAIMLLQKEQETSGAAAGSWWGRWGSNYNYGTGNVLRGLVWLQVAAQSRETARSVQCCGLKGVRTKMVVGVRPFCHMWTLGSAGCGKSNAAQTGMGTRLLITISPIDRPGHSKRHTVAHSESDRASGERPGCALAL